MCVYVYVCMRQDGRDSVGEVAVFMDRMRWRFCAHGGKGRVDGGIEQSGHTAARNGSMLEKSRSYESSKVYTWQQKDGWPLEMFSSFTNQKCC